MEGNRLFFIVASSTGREALLLRAGHGWSLPAYDRPVAENVGFDDPAPFNRWFRRRYGIDVVRRYAVETAGADPVLFVLECRSAKAEPPEGGRWVGPDDLARTPVSPPSVRPLLEAWFADPGPSRTMPQSGPAGYDQAIAWLLHALQELHLTPAGPLEQVKNTYVSTVFRCPTDGGDVYLKLLPRIFIRELEVTRTLADWRIAELPVWLASDAQKGFILMKDTGGCDLAECCEVDLVKAALRRFAALQVASVPLVNVESPGPFYDWRLPVLIDQIDAAVEDARRLLRGSEHDLTSAEASRLRSRLPYWKELCSRAAQTHLPDALDHGDLRPGNVRVVSGRMIFYDWAWSAVTHPFLAAAGFLDVLRHWLPQTPDVRDALRDCYLEPWLGYGALEDLREAFHLLDSVRAVYGTVADAEWLRCVHTALDWRSPAPALADAWTLGRRQHYFARMIRRLL